MKNMKKSDEKYLKTKKGRANNLLCAYRANDKKYNRGEGDLTAQWIVDNIFSKPCAHCGETDWRKIGCNRIDNDKPHSKDNVEPCCKTCNDALARTEFKDSQTKKVYQYTLDGDLVKIWDSTRECGRNGFNQGCIAACCRGGRINKGQWENCKTYKGYKWSYYPL
jgi:hypothetical protein